MLQQLDFIGHVPSLYVDSSQRYKTKFGAIMTIITAVLSILAIAAFGKDMVLRENPILFQYDYFNALNEINFKDKPFLIGLVKGPGSYIKDLKRKLQVKFNYLKINSSDANNPLFEVIPYDLVPCMETELYKNNTLNLKGMIDADGLDNYFCLPDSMKNLSLIGQLGNSIFFEGLLHVTECKNSTINNNHCYPREEILKDKDLTSFWGHYIYMDRYLDLTNYDQPIKEYWRSDLLPLFSHSTRSDLYTSRIVEIRSDEGIVLESFNNGKTNNLYNKGTSTADYNNEYFLSIGTDVNNISLVLGRKYLKIQAVMANAGGFIKSILLILIFINKFVSRRLYIEQIYINSVAQYNEFYKNFSLSAKNNYETELNSQTNRSNLKNPIEEKTINSDGLKVLPLIKNNKEDIYNQKNKYHGNEKRKIRYKKLGIASFLCFKKKQFKIVDHLDKIYTSQMDVIKLFYLFKRFTLTEKLIFGISGEKWKNFIVDKTIATFQKNNKNLKSDDLVASLENLKNTQNVLDINKILYREIVENEIIKE